ncbi:MAG: hypothetical protein A3H98_06510 [Bacteroidetes bacterium RIFCSPLOWO2_02_FULL_36_8]|nr:MAG: hypothetical protein A3H98_06510 [Bacteroidetes bacterium RIFCSPLOWO2_02_FULL_36_8]OFY71116.1 MAG: hypothetical protein A3G23_15015 [Bacteroidetes bacterium RIFCSPLOWO2_12_FULL_37_12]
MLSQKCKYAIRAILHLATHTGTNEKKNIKVLAGELKIPTPYLGKILQGLVPKNIISSIKGPNGGFFMTEKNLKTPLITIVEAIDGLSFFETCGLGLEECSDTHPCPIHNDFKKIRTFYQNLLVKKTIGKFSVEIKDKEWSLVR